MRQDIHIRHSDIEDAGDQLVDVHNGKVVSVKLGKYFESSVLFIPIVDAETIATRILDAIREARTMRCDLCGVEAVLDGLNYKHLDPDGSGRLWISCTVVNDNQPSGQGCTVNGKGWISRAELGEMTVDQLL